MHLAKTITKEELAKTMEEKPETQLVNVLEPAYYNLGMIKGSTRIPLSELEHRFNELDKNKEVVTYCAGAACEASKKAAELLVGHGFEVRVYEGGINEWKESGMPFESFAAAA